jgi:WD40 repeat protein
MASDTTVQFDREDRLEEVVLAYLRDAGAGRAPDPRQLLDRHPDLAPELAEFFDAQDLLTPLVAPLRALHGPLCGAGSTVGDYELEQEVGRGGMGVVYRARQKSLNRVVALKMIRAGELASADEVRRFRTEAENAAALDHPHIVPIYEVGEHEGQHYFSMKLIDGGPLAPLPPHLANNPRAVAALMARVARAVHYAHQRGILHRDLKPANILLDAQGRPHVTDFGLAKRVEGEAGLVPPQEPERAAGRPGTGLAGTPGYMAPEQAAAARGLSTAVDVYGLGAVLYELLTGRPPFQGAATAEILRQVREVEPVRPRKLRPRTDRDLELICLTCLRKDPQQRYGSAEALADDLQRFADRRPIAIRRAGWGERTVKWARRQPMAAAVVLLLVLLAGLGVGVVIPEAIKREEQRRESQARLYTFAIALAQLYIAGGEYHRAEDTLNLCPQNLRRWEWRYLWGQAHREPIVLRGHTGLVQAVQYSPDGSRLATASRDGTARVWDAATGELQLTLRGHLSGVRNIGFAGGGRWVVTAGEDQAVKFWDAATGGELNRIAGAGDLLAAARRGNVVATVGRKKVLAVWSGLDDQPLFSCPLKNNERATSLALSPDGRYLVVGGFDRLLRVWDLRDAGREVRLEVPEGDKVVTNVWSVSFSSDGHSLAVGSAQLGIWDVATGKFVGSVSGPGDLICSSISFSRDGGFIAASDNQGLVRVWDNPLFKAVLGPRKHTGPAAIAFSPREERQLAVTRDLEVTVEDIGPINPTASRVLKFGPKARVAALAFDPDGRQLATRARDGEILLWDVAGGMVRRKFQARPAGDDRASVAFGDGGRLLLSGDGSGLEVWETATGQPSADLAVPLQGARCAAFSPDGRRLATADQQARLAVWDRHGRTPLLSWDGGTGGVVALAFSPDGRLLVSFGDEGPARLWNAATGKEVGFCRGHMRAVTGAAFSPDSKRLATSSADLTVRVWDAHTCQELLVLHGHSSYVSGVAYSPDGKRLASCSRDGVVRIWDADTGEEMLSLKGHESSVPAVAFSPDGRTLATCGHDGPVRLWEASAP